MVPVGRLNLLSDKTRFIAAVGGVAFAVTLILMVQALYAGYRRSVATLIRDMPVDVWVGQAGAFDLFRSTTIVPAELAGQVQAVDGVRSAWQMRAHQVSFETSRGNVRSLLIAFNAGPASEGLARALGLSSLPGRGEMVISDYVRKHGDIEDGDRIVVNGVPVTVSGRISVPSPPFGSFSLINFEDAESIFRMPGLVSYVLVSTADAQDAQTAAAEIQSRFPGTSAYTRDEFTASNGRTVNEFLPVVGVLLFVSYLVGIMVASLTIYTATVENTRDYGVLKAIGASNWYVYSMVIYQSVWVSLAGFVVGLPLAVLASELANRQVPEFITAYSLAGLSGTFAAVFLMSLLSAFLPARRIAGIDPAMVFRP